MHSFMLLLLAQDVVWRVGSSFLGPLKPDFMSVTMTSPDLYGPFWVATTLIFVTAGRSVLLLGWCWAGFVRVVSMMC